MPNNTHRQNTYSRFGRLEAVAVFDDQKELQDSVDELQSAGFNRADFSVLPAWSNLEKILGYKLDTIADALDNPDIPRSIQVSTRSLGTAQGVLIFLPVYVGSLCGIGLAASGGAGLAAISLAALAGGLIGAALGIAPALSIKRRYRRRIEDQIDRGGLVLWVAADNRDRAERAKKVLNSHHAQEVRLQSAVAA